MEHQANVALQMEENTRRKDEARAKLLKIQPDSAQTAAGPKDGGHWLYQFRIILD